MKLSAALVVHSYLNLVKFLHNLSPEVLLQELYLFSPKTKLAKVKKNLKLLNIEYSALDEKGYLTTSTNNHEINNNAINLIESQKLIVLPGSYIKGNFQLINKGDIACDLIIKCDNSESDQIKISLKANGESFLVSDKDIFLKKIIPDEAYEFELLIEFVEDENNNKLQNKIINVEVIINAIQSLVRPD